MGIGTRIWVYRKFTALALTGSLLAAPLGACDLGEFTTSSTVTLSGREVISFVVRSAILTPIENAVNRGVDYVFNKLEGDEDDDD